VADAWAVSREANSVGRTTRPDPEAED
jgi:hypothetical protein